MVDWQMLEGIGGIATAIAVVVALGFGLVQVRHSAVERRERAATDIIAHLLTEEIVEALDRIMRLPEDAPAEIIADDASLRRDVLLVDLKIEGAGMLVYQRRIALHDFDRMMGGYTRQAWHRVRRYIIAERERVGAPGLGEWWQWLVERMEEDPAPGKHEGAHVAFRDWQR